MPISNTPIFNRIFVLKSLFFVILLGYLIYPAFYSVHVEGFSAQVESIAILKAEAPNLLHDPYLPLITRFIYETRSLVIEALSAIYQLFPESGDLPFKSLVLASFILIVISSVKFVSRWQLNSWLFSIAALVLIQGLVESSFFFNDNIIAAAITAASLCVIGSRNLHFTSVISGLLFSFALLARIDSVMILPIILGAILISSETRLLGIKYVAYFAVSSATVLMLHQHFLGFTLLDSLSIAGKFSNVYPITLKRQFLARMFFLGAAILPFLIVGMVRNFKQYLSDKQYFKILTFIVYPILVFLFAPKATEVRYIFLLLVPIVALHTVAGLNSFYLKFSRLASFDGRAWLVCGYLLVACFAPPIYVQVMDGPRSFIGRFWTPLEWIKWQESVDQSMENIQETVTSLSNGRKNILISTHWNDEFYERMQFIKNGFLPVSTAEYFPGCNGFSVLKKDDTYIIHIRTAPQYNIVPIDYLPNAGLQLSTAFSCPAIKAYDKVVLTTYGEWWAGSFSTLFKDYRYHSTQPSTIYFFDALGYLNSERINRMLNNHYGVIRSFELTKNEALEVESNSRIFSEKNHVLDKKGKPISIEDYLSAYR